MVDFILIFYANFFISLTLCRSLSSHNLQLKFVIIVEKQTMNTKYYCELFERTLGSKLELFGLNTTIFIAKYSY